MKKQIKGSLCLLLCTTIWGFAFIAQSVGMDKIGPFTFQAVRCALAVLFLIPCSFLMELKSCNVQESAKKWKNPTLWKVGLICGCAGSTASGIKVDRLIILFKSIGRYVNNILHPNSVNEVRLGKRILRDEEVSPHLLYIGLYAVVIVVSTLLVLCTGTDPANSLVGTISSLANIGPASGDMGNLGNFNHLPTLSKLIFSVDMFLGRIEIYPVLAVLGMMLTKRNR